MLYISKKSGFQLCISATIVLLCFILYPIALNASLISQQKFICVIAVVIVAYILISTYFLEQKLNPYHIFISLTYLFMFGQQTLLLLGANKPNITLLSEKLPASTLYFAGFFIIFSILSMHIGYLLTRRSKKCLGLQQDAKVGPPTALYQFACIMFALFLLPTLVTLGNDIILTIVYGYGKRIIDTSLSTSLVMRICSILASFMPSILILLHISKSATAKLPIIATLFYLLAYMASGSRIRAFILVLTLCCIYYQKHTLKKISFKNVIVAGALVFVAAILFSVVSNVRSSTEYAQNMLSATLNGITDVWKNNVVSEVLEETGYTFYVTANVLTNSPNPIAPLNGMSYISGLSYILPNFMTGNFYNSILDTDKAFQGFITIYGGMGSSFIAEGYYNFGIYSLLLFFVFGLLWGWFMNKIDLTLVKNHYTTYFLCMLACSYIFFYVRSDTRTFFRNFIWFGVSLVLLFKLLYPKKRLPTAENILT